MPLRIGELIKNRELLYMIAWRDIHIKYKQSIMGFMWAILMPMLIVLTGALVRLLIARLSGNQVDITQIASVSVKAVPWAFFVSSIRFATNSLIGNGNLVTKIYFPKEIFPLSAILSQLFDFMIASIALIVFLVIAGVGWSIHLLWVFPLLLILVMLVGAMGIFLSAANLFFRDVKYLVEVILTFAIFFTPVFYDSDLAGKWQSLVLLNPVAPVLEGLNSCIVLHRMPDLRWVGYSFVVSAFGMLLSILLFKRLEPKFAESI
jgi:ABC-type polysaccharide/polyol phosphate export permease